MDGKEEFPSLTDMPAEIIELILSEKCLDYADLKRLSETCSKMHQISNSNDLWKRKFQQRWQSSLLLYDKQSTKSWKEEYISRHKFVAKVCRLLDNMSPKYFHKDELSKEDFHEFTALAESHAGAAEFLLSELLSVLHDDQPNKNLTLKFYAAQAVRLIQHLLLKPKILAYLNDVPPEEQKIEIGATLVAQWCQPTERITESDVCGQLDRLAQEVRDILRKDYPEHSLLQQDINQDGISQDMWNSPCSEYILSTINRVLYDKHGFEGANNDNNNSFNITPLSYIDKVFKTKKGIPIVLCVIYAAVARRLGVVCEPVNAPYHFMLRWKQHPFKPPDQMYVYINAYDGGKRLKLSEVAQEIGIDPKLITTETMVYATPCHVIEREVRNLMHIGQEQGKSGDYNLLRTALELSVLMKGHNIEARLNLVRINLHLGVNLDEAQQILHYVAGTDASRIGLVAHMLNAIQEAVSENKEREKNQKTHVKQRKKSKNVEFAVGLVMRHKRYNYDCVIYGWDYKCEASQQWILQMGVNQLPKKDAQPFYNVLVEDGSKRYAAQENLEFHQAPHGIGHCDVGKYFSSFDGYRYIMNSEKATEYPDDEDFCAELVHRQYHS